MKIKYIFTHLLLILSVNAFSQVANFKGKVLDVATNAPLPGALLQVGPWVGTTNAEGYFETKLPDGNYTVKITFLGYLPLEQKIKVPSAIPFTFNMTSKAIEGKTVQVKSTKAGNMLENATMGTVTISSQLVKSLPVVFGEPDVLKALTLLPGIKSGGEGNSGIYVRGGGPDQNLFLLDEAQIYNPSHLLGFFSAFNADAVQDIEVVKGGMPPRFGGRLSSVVNVTQREGNYNKWNAQGGLGLISSRLTLEGPLAKDKVSIIASARRTYADVLARPFLPDSLKGNGLFFYDLNLKVAWKINATDRLTLSAYKGRDQFSFKSNDASPFTFNTNWGNEVVSLKWLKQLNSKWYAQTTAYYSNYDFKSTAESVGFNVTTQSGVADIALRHEQVITLSDKLNFRAGGGYTWHTFTPGSFQARFPGQQIAGGADKQFAHETYLFAQTAWNFAARWLVEAGFRWSYFNQVGPYKKPLYNELGEATGEFITTPNGKSVANYAGPEPRINMRYTLTDQSALKASFSRVYQYLHLATSSSATLPTDLWVPSSQAVRPQISTQYALGYFREMKNKQYDLSVEAYYKPMLNQVELKPGAQVFVNRNLENDLIFGRGLSYGVEMLLRKNAGRFNGWLGYTWSKTTRTFEALNDGKPFFYRFDRRHDISLVLSYELSAKWKANFVFVYGTGNAFTLPTSRFAYFVGQEQNNPIPVFTIIDRYQQINNIRLPAYHRADISFNYLAKKTAKWESSWNFSIYNLYSRANPYFVYFSTNFQNGTVQPKMVYLFPILPSVTWNFKF